jgi:hypothetical protein
MHDRIILPTLREAPALLREIERSFGTPIYTVETHEAGEGPTITRTDAIIEPVACLTVKALLAAQEIDRNRIAELEDQIQSTQDRADAEVESVKDELAKANRGDPADSKGPALLRAWSALDLIARARSRGFDANYMEGCSTTTRPSPA